MADIFFFFLFLADDVATPVTSSSKAMRKKQGRQEGESTPLSYVIEAQETFTFMMMCIACMSKCKFDLRQLIREK